VQDLRLLLLLQDGYNQKTCQSRKKQYAGMQTEESNLITQLVKEKAGVKRLLTDAKLENVINRDLAERDL